jgi:lysophospholipase L1-like esterase
MFRRFTPVAVLVAALFVSACSEPETSNPYNESAAVVAIGDSIMVAATERLSGLVDGIVIDAEVGRPFRDGIDALERQLAGGGTPDILVVALGTNAGTTSGQIDELMGLADGVGEVILVNVRVPRDWETSTNDVMADAAARYDIVRIVDWHGASDGSDHLFRTDGYHPNETGSELWANLIVVEIKR